MGLGFMEGSHVALQSGFIGDKLQHRRLADGNIPSEEDFQVGEKQPSYTGIRIKE